MEASSDLFTKSTGLSAMYDKFHPVSGSTSNQWHHAPWFYWMQQLFLCPLESLKRSRILGRYFSKYKSCLLLKAPRRFCLMNCTASSYFIPPSINARATSTGALWRIFDILFFKVKFWKIQYSKHSPIQNHYYLCHTSCVSIYRKCWTLIKYHFHISKFSSIKRKLVTT